MNQCRVWWRGPSAFARAKLPHPGPRPLGGGDHRATPCRAGPGGPSRTAAVPPGRRPTHAVHVMTPAGPRRDSPHTAMDLIPRALGGGGWGGVDLGSRPRRVPRPVRPSRPPRHDWGPAPGGLVSQPPRQPTVPKAHQGAGGRDIPPCLCLFSACAVCGERGDQTCH